MRDSLSKPAGTIYRHNLALIIESALRSCGLNPSIVSRLDVRLLEASSGETGWDVFTLDYHVESPINTVITTQAMQAYQKIFTFLWRIKRMEHVLASNWRRQSTHSSLFKIAEFKSLFHASHLMANGMVHFVNQLQHYILFEGVESAWEELERFIETSGDLDQIIGAHNKYINRITANAFLIPSPNSHKISITKQILGLFEEILKFENIQKDLIEQARKINSGAKVFEFNLVRIRDSLADCADAFHVCLF